MSLAHAANSTETLSSAERSLFGSGKPLNAPGASSNKSRRSTLKLPQRATSQR